MFCDFSFLLSAYQNILHTSKYCHHSTELEYEEKKVNNAHNSNKGGLKENKKKAIMAENLIIKIEVYGEHPPAMSWQ